MVCKMENAVLWQSPCKPPGLCPDPLLFDRCQLSHSFASLHGISLQPGDRDHFAWQVRKKSTGSCSKLLTVLPSDSCPSLASLPLENNPMGKSLKLHKEQKM